ncbi:MAG: hypothetical protein M1819_003126 [Sarea resinae]|nr:MAG: hypothetical protein M1819_003126 [Sarea resinae]
MNGADSRVPEPDNLRGFYAYKNTFDDSSVWLDVPKQVTFINNNDPYAYPSSPELRDIASTPRQPEQFADAFSPDAWSMSDTFQQSTPVSQVHGLEALSAAASGDRLNFLPPNPAREPDHSHRMSYSPAEEQTSFRKPASIPPNLPRTVASPPNSLSSSSNSNLNFILNPSSTASPSIDPNLRSSFEPRSQSSSDRPKSGPRDLHAARAEGDHEIAFLLRHFSETPGQWMDLFDRGTFFSSYVPVKALKNPLLKYAAIAYAAKHLGRIKGRKTILGGSSSRQANMELYPDCDKVDWYYKGAKYYDKAISLLMEALKEDRGDVSLSNQDAGVQWQTVEVSENGEDDRRKRRRVGDGQLSRTRSDELLAATAILCVYEFLDASGAAWSRHLNGTKSLLDIAEVGMMPVYSNGLISQRQRLHPSKARRATFWNFARQDFLAAFINQGSTRLDTEDLVIWKDAGLLLDDEGFVQPSSTTNSVYPDDYSDGHGDNDDDDATMMHEDMISNALVWLLSKIVNFTAAGDAIYGPSEKPPSYMGVNQETLLQRWHELARELEVWHARLPSTFKPCARLEPSSTSAFFSSSSSSSSSHFQRSSHHHFSQADITTNTAASMASPSASSSISCQYPNQTYQLPPAATTATSSASSASSSPPWSIFPEIWYSLPMCASTMQSYHMARILLLINKPQISTALPQSRSSPLSATLGHTPIPPPGGPQGSQTPSNSITSPPAAHNASSSTPGPMPLPRSQITTTNTISTRLHSYRSISSSIQKHSYAICGIASSRSTDSVRIHGLQPLFVAGQCFCGPSGDERERERQGVVALLEEVERDTGWAVGYRVGQLKREWGGLEDDGA